MSDVLRRAQPIMVGLAAIVIAIGGVSFTWPSPRDAAVPGATGAPAGTDAVNRAPLDCGGPDADGSLRFSAESGFYAQPFELAITVPASAHPVHFTLDGSTPDLVANPGATITYTDPFPVDGSLVADPPISAYRTQIDAEAARERRAGDPLWDLRPPEGQTATVVRARTSHGRECTAVFFVGDHLVRDRLPVLHLSLDPDHLFDHDTGIAVPGATFDDYLDSRDFDAEEFPRRMPGNFSNRGREWERPAEDDLGRPVVLHFFEPGGELAYETDLGLRIHGGVTRERAQKSLRLYARNDYGDRSLRYPFFGDEGAQEHRRLILRNSGNDSSRTHLLDGYIQDVAAELGVETQAYRPAVVFLNGEYWGILNLRDRYDRHYLGIVHGVDPGNVALIEGVLEPYPDDDDEIDESYARDVEDFKDLLAFVDRADLADPSAYAELEARMDLDDFLDYVLVEIFVSNTDWPGSNTKLWRERVEPGSGQGVRDGRWRWMLNDLDHLGAHQRDATHNQLERLMQFADDPEHWTGIPSLLDNLLDAPRFREAFETRFEELLDTTFHPDRTVPMLRERAERIEAEMPLHLERWDERSIESWRDLVDQLEAFMVDRPDIQRAQLQEFLDGRD